MLCKRSIHFFPIYLPACKPICLLYGRVTSYFIQWAIIYCFHYLFCYSNCPKFGQREFLQGGSCVLSTCPHLLSTLLLSGTMSSSRIILYSLCSNPGVSHFSKKLWFLLVTNDKSRCAHWAWRVIVLSAVTARDVFPYRRMPTNQCGRNDGIRKHH